MGLDIGGAMILGVRLTRDQYDIQKTRPSCDHPAANGFKHCPECGVKVGMITKTVSAEWVRAAGKVGPFSIERGYGGDEEWIVVGIIVKEIEEQRRMLAGAWQIPPPPSPEIEESIRAELLKLGIPTGVGQFGYWLSIYSSSIYSSY